MAGPRRMSVSHHFQLHPMESWMESLSPEETAPSGLGQKIG